MPLTQTQEKTASLLASLWLRNRPLLEERLGVLDRAASCAADGTLFEELREEAADTAHKLAGSLGMYGYQQGTEVASKMESIFKSPTPEKLLTLRALSLDLRKSLADGL